MKSTKIEPEIQSILKRVIQKYPPVSDIVQAIHAQGGRSLLVGGATRDLMMKLPEAQIKDLDIEVHGISLEQLEDILKQFGQVSLVGKSFGVLRLHGLDVDWSLPRTDTSGRKPKVHIDPHMGFKQAFARRDLTINAMGIDLITYELIDPFDGLEDLRKKILRAPDPKFFVEDSLRFYRVMQFMSRFEFMPDEQLEQLCKRMDVSKVSVERIEQEFRKMLLRSTYPSLGIRWLKKIERLSDIFPELGALVNTPQNPEWHPEGDVFEHTMQSLDAAAALKYKTDDEKLIILYAALCHDLGKAVDTKFEEGKIVSIGHEKESAKLTKQLLKRIMRNNIIIDTVKVLVRNHMAPSQFVEQGAKLAAYKRLARKLTPYATLSMLAKLAYADKRGRNATSYKPLSITIPEIDEFLIQAQQAQVLQRPEEPVLQGRDLINEVPPGPALGELLKKAYLIQIEEGITDKEELKRRVLPKS